MKSSPLATAIEERIMSSPSSPIGILLKISPFAASSTATPAPKFLAALGVVPGQTVTADDQNFRASLVFERDGGAKSLPGFSDRLARADPAPKRLAGSRIEGEQIRFDVALAAPVALHRHIA